jgi:hypothetical protein
MTSEKAKCNKDEDQHRANYVLYVWMLNQNKYYLVLMLTVLNACRTMLLTETKLIESVPCVVNHINKDYKRISIR